LPKNITLYGGENYICDHIDFAPGRTLVFLKKRNGFLVGSNWNASVCPIKDGKLDWYTGKNRFSKQPQDESIKAP
jgi:hypothetical protein